MWLTPVLDWSAESFYNFGDLNRVENNSEEIAVLMNTWFQTSVTLVGVNKTRTMKAIDFADSLNRIEGNLELLRQRYTPATWIASKLDWAANRAFDFNDAARLEKNLAALYFYYRGNVDNFRYCGAYTCGEGVV